MSELFADRAAIGTESRLAQLFGGQLGPDGIKFSAGNPNPDLFPTAQMQNAFNTAIDTAGNHLFEYQEVAGPVHLRQQLANRVHQTAGINATADNVLVTQGGQQAIDLVAKLLLDTGDEVAVETPTYVGALASFDQYGPTYLDVPMEDDGMDVDALAALLKTHPNIKLVYTVPDFHNPTGVTMSVAKRKRLVELAEEYHFYILEDTPYRDLRYHGHSLPAIKSFDRHGRVIFISSFSKILMPGLRTGWVVADEMVINKLRQLKETSDLESPAIMLHAVSAFLDNNDLNQHVANMLTTYRNRLDAMLNALTEFMPDTVKFTRPDGGFFVWLTLPENVDTQALLQDVVMPQAHISYVPGQVFFAHQNVHNGLRLNFSGVDEQQITAGIQRLATALTKNTVKVQ
ncbi:MAG: PLP-dependent aminotransferase family protein [Furfurilactobacillus sp.]|jgi:DNA-binding transcriptional MocR family regulator|uniref:PLP-dependent aminotransferase family protein n=1 Tax=Furfurilactobacillus milii TaxID=2888272 RepID=A0ABT6DBD3_9LACO|nr:MULTISPECIES: PLP-dependent aminotransferase family protein [Furfurilactobacillus]QLE67363.1 Aspartate aminotransferase AspB-4 [Furfurilactobacillus rossiae]MCF6161556.1 PLP-dependent aminotransferase family protein [Furfurilactobacillus milii]MCF6163936.1 PLP-dependent aminotransferase family protein [Furfurilactobacillus milii]MCH4011552.1 PLP-dependent aminotransferase family protein [Furfurilactobacillus sp.]MCH4037444.1 PLP-dependent aminotransferase family protein [Furfurilactobacillu